MRAVNAALIILFTSFGEFRAWNCNNLDQNMYTRLSYFITQSENCRENCGRAGTGSGEAKCDCLALPVLSYFFCFLSFGLSNTLFAICYQMSSYCIKKCEPVEPGDGSDLRCIFVILQGWQNLSYLVFNDLVWYGNIVTCRLKETIKWTELIRTLNYMISSQLYC